MDIGQVLKPQGIRGEIKVKPLTSDAVRFNALRYVCVGGRQYRIVGVRIAADGVYLRLDGIADRNAAETLRGMLLSVDNALAVALDEGEFFIAELIGAELCARGEDGTVKRVGAIKRVDGYGAADVFEITCDGGKDLSFAFVKALCPVFDKQNKRLIVDASKLAEVAVYEN